MDFLVLGPLRIVRDDSGQRLAAKKQRMLLAVLLIHANRVVSTDQLLEEVWGIQQPSSGVQALRYHLSKLRVWLDPGRKGGDQGLIVSQAGGYLLRVAPGAVDANRFAALAEEGASLLADGNTESARDVLREALNLWRGEAFDDFRYDAFAQVTSGPGRGSR